MTPKRQTPRTPPAYNHFDLLAGSTLIVIIIVIVVILAAALSLVIAELLRVLG